MAPRNPSKGKEIKKAKPVARARKSASPPKKKLGPGKIVNKKDPKAKIANADLPAKHKAKHPPKDKENHKVSEITVLSDPIMNIIEIVDHDIEVHLHKKSFAKKVAKKDKPKMNQKRNLKSLKLTEGQIDIQNFDKKENTTKSNSVIQNDTRSVEEEKFDQSHDDKLKDLPNTDGSLQQSSPAEPQTLNG